MMMMMVRLDGDDDDDDELTIFLFSYSGSFYFINSFEGYDIGSLVFLPWRLCDDGWDDSVSSIVIVMRLLEF